MTVDSRPEHAATPADGPSVHVIRARKLLIGGAVGGVAAAALCLIVFTIGFGTSGLISAALAAAMVLFFYGVGQYVMVLFADAGARTLLTVSMCSYTARVVDAGTGSGALQRPPRSLADVDTNGHLPDDDHRCRGMAGS